MSFQTLRRFGGQILNDESTTATLAQIIQTYAKTKQLNKGKHLHAHLLRTHYPLCLFLTNHLLNMYSKCAHPDYALKLFDQMPQRNLVSWTAMVTGFSQNSRFSESFQAFSQMIRAGESPTQFAFASVIRGCVVLGSVGIGRQLHCLALKMGLGCELFVGSNLADMYSKCGVMVEACRVFEEMPSKDAVSWTSMIDGYAKSGEFEAALVSYKRMISDEIGVDKYVVSSALSACCGLRDCQYGKCVHSTAVKLGLEVDVAVGNALVDMYSKSGDMESASNVFQIDPGRRNIVSYSSLINGYVEMDEVEKAFSVFVDLQREGVEPNQFTFSSLIKACANQAALEQGIQLHAQVVKFNFGRDDFVVSVLVDMYGKCGLLDRSIQVFNEIGTPSEVAWNSLLSVFAVHGLGNDALRTFSRLVQAGVKPNAITFISLLTGCSHSGLVEEGLKYFHSMEKTYGIVPRAGHYSCVIDLLGRAGRLQEAEEFINSMPMQPNAFGWCSFLGACTIHGDKERGKLAAEKLIRLEPENSGAHVLLSTLHAKEQKWEDFRSVRKMMKDSSMKKLPGYSWVDVGNKTHTFGAEDWSHPQKKEIYEKLDSLLCEIKKAGYVPKTDLVLHDMDENSKVELLHHHSERIALAFALISMPAGKPIIVKKNIRVCLDCHSAIKYISLVVGREIIVRDNTRFHHFADGLCSCADYW
ncbi:putative pentatricopeptide repeat-containing protein At5g52630 [Argentina anserina]|uniref:putative pentatricopeptide repeat-containing protein At5g52630 n=1 Tax=Argentina anserina TaxID=57926 RepID=UPI0021768C7B|nr:putative pentatricopeptide repeat-containing protein At5g52630 [Potentilla anserina]